MNTPTLALLLGLLDGGSASYLNTFRSVAKDAQLAVWPLTDAALVAADLSGNGYDVTVTGLTPRAGTIQGQLVYSGDAVNDVMNALPSGVGAAFDGTQGSISIWIDPTTWSPVSTQYVLNFSVNSSNRIYIILTTTGDQLSVNYSAGGVEKIINHTFGETPTLPTHVGLSWDAVADEVRMIVDGVQSGATQTGLGVWAGSIVSATLFAGNAAAVGPYGGLGGFAGLYNRALTDAEWLQLGTRVG